MVDSIEIRLDQLTEAIKGLYAKSSMSQGEIYNALTSLSQRYENLNNVTSEKIATTLVNEFRKTIETKQAQTNQLIKSLEDSLRNLANTHSAQNPKMAAEISRLLNDTAATFTKLSAQDVSLQKIFNTLELQKNNDPSLQISKLNENFINFSRGFENITITLNKNFADFLSQIKQDSPRDQYMAIKSDLDIISGNVNSVISAISIIDSKYKDLTGLIDVIQHRENIFNDALREVKTLTDTLNNMQDSIKSIDPRIELQALSNEVRTQLENVKYEIQKVVNTASDSGIKAEIFNLTSNIDSVNNNVQNLSTNLTSTKDEIQNLTTTVQGLGGELKNVHGLINDEILYKNNTYKQEYEKYLNSAKDEVKNLLIGLSTFKNDLSAINSGNIKILQEPIERAMSELRGQEIGKNMKELSDNLRDVALEIQSTIQNMQQSLNDINSVSATNVLAKITESIPTISDKLEIFRTHVVSENSANLSKVRTAFDDTIVTLQSNLKDAVDKIQEDTKAINIETLDTLKIDLQKLSDHLIDNVETLNDRIQKEFVNFKAEFQEFSLKQTDSLDKTMQKISNLELGLENFTQETVEKINDSINSNNANTQDTLNEIRGDILEGISNVSKNNKNSFIAFESKIDKLLDNYIGADLDNIVEKKSLRETVVDIETKIDRTNLQQIHNAKELLEEIQSSASNISLKIANIEESKNIASILSAISKISEKVQTIEESHADLNQSIEITKEEIDQKLKDNVQKISVLVEKQRENPLLDSQNSNIDELSKKVQEYLSNFEYLKANISQEIKENLEGEFAKVEDSIKKIRTSEENSNYSYTLEDIESDLAKIKLTVDKTVGLSDDFKTLFEKLVELRTVGLETVKTNHDIESEIGNLAGWFKDVSMRIDDVAERVTSLERTGFDEIKTRLIQSEKSKKNVIEFNAKIENALRILVKNSQNQESKIIELNKKIELLTQTQSESFNPNQFIDIFYENMTQTKMLSNRIEIIENKMSSIQGVLEKLITYIES